MLSRQPPDHTTFDNRTEQQTDIIANTSPHVLQAWLLYQLSKMRQDADRRMKIAKRRYKDEHDRKVRNATLSFTDRQYVYIDRPPL